MHKVLRLKYLPLLISVFACLCSSLHGQQNDSVKYSTSQIEVTGSRISLNPFTSPTKVQLIGRKEIENKNGETLADVLQPYSGVMLKSYGGNNSLSTISMNGLGAEHTLILLDGFKLNSTQNNLVDLSTVLKDDIEKIEILNNGMSSIYGSEAMGGVINIVTTKPAHDKLNVSMKLQAGSYEQRKIFLSTGAIIGGTNVEATYSTESAQNDFNYYFDNGVEKTEKQRLNSAYDVSNYLLSVNHIFNKKLNLSLRSSYLHRNDGIPGIETGSAPSNAVQKDKLWNNVLALSKKSGNHSQIKVQFNFQNNQSNYDNGNFANSYYRNLYISGMGEFDYTTDLIEVDAGYDLSYSRMNSNETTEGTKRTQSGIFAVTRFNASGKLIIYPSLRYDYISDIDKNVLSGKLGLNFKPFEKHNLHVKASAGNNFAAPTFNELYWRGLGNGKLIPEKSLNIDAGVIYGFEFLTNNIIEFDFSYIDAEEKIVWTPGAGGIWRPENTGRSVSNVFLADLGVSKNFNDQIFFTAGLNYSYTSSLKKSTNSPEDPTYNKQTFYIPEHALKCRSSLSINHTGINLFYTFTGSRFIDLENKQSLPQFQILDGNISQEIPLSSFVIQVRFDVNNILNEDYQVVSGYPMPLRNYKLSLNIEY